MLLTNSVPYGTYQTDYNKYIMDPSNEVVEIRKGGKGNLSFILKYQDNTEWVFLPKKPEERFCGFLYLQKALEESNLNKIQAAENKIAIHDREIIYLSRWHGDKKIDYMDLYELSGYENELSTLYKIGFTDTVGYSNFRKQDGVLYVFDTEKSSFDKSVHEKIDSFVQQHNIIRSVLEESLK